jgi:uncharacterized protein (DUF58 family)
MLSLLRESSKKSPYQSRFAPPKLASEFNLKGTRVPTGQGYTLILETRFWYLVAVVAILYFMAIETGKDWLYLIASGGVAAIILGVTLPLSQLLDLNCSCSIPPDAVSGDRLKVRVRLTRISGKTKWSKFLPIKWIVVRTKLVGLREEESILRPITVDTVVNEAWVVAQSPPLARGVYRLEELETYSCFPFGLAWWAKSFDINEAANVTNPVVTVYSRTVGVEGNFLWRLRAAGTSALMFSATRSTSVMPSSSVRSLREFVTGDSPRMIHWASSAKTGKLLVREFESEGLPGYDVLIDLLSPWKNEEQFELAVSLANSLLNLGFRMGGAPELYVIPDPLERVELLPLCLKDVPPTPPGIARWAQILARVEALQVAPNFEASIPDFGADKKLALLAIRPAQETSEVAPLVEETVEMWVMSRAFKEPSSAAEKAESWQRKGGLPASAGFSERRGVGAGNAPSLGRLLTTIERFEDIARV